MTKTKLRPDTQNWSATSLYDIETAKHMLQTKRYLYVVFMCHLALEKMLKAHVAEVTQSPPVRSHDLIYLLRKASLTQMPGDYLKFLGKINNASVPTRYPDDLQRAMKEYDAPIAQSYLSQTKEVLQWLHQHPNLQIQSIP